MALNVCSYHDIIESADSTLQSLPVISLDISALWGIPLTKLYVLIISLSNRALN